MTARSKSPKTRSIETTCLIKPSIYEVVPKFGRGQLLGFVFVLLNR